MDKDTKLAIIIINWNKAPDTLHCLCMISRWSGLKAEVIVVDNGSSHEDLSLLQNAKYRFQLVVNGANKGYAGGNNAGIIKALDEGFPYIMLLNSDATISESCVKQLLDCMKHSPDLGVVGPLLEERGRNYAGGRNIGVYSRTRIPYEPRDSDPELLTVDYVPGSVLLARREAFEKAGLLDEEFFFSGEIADFCRRVQLAGHRCAVYTGCRASHKPDMNSTMRETLYSYYTLRNRFLFVRRHFRYAKIFWIMRWIISGIVQIIIALLRRKRGLAHALWLGLWDGVTGRFGDRNAHFIS
ncbi:MAG TPA: glycosyltransferase family 2 protein [Methanoregulaceae archaeon]|nr:glycosyltransferase family 2 protein [Methanoregulaceae archaeon]